MDKIKTFYGEKLQQLQAKIKTEIQGRISQEKDKLLQTQLSRGDELNKVIASKLGLLKEQDDIINQKIAGK